MPSLGTDQASGLRRLFGGKRLQVISFAAAGEGVGKTHVVANLAAALARQGLSVFVLDENSGQDNVAGLFGRPVGHDLLEVIQGRATIENVLVELSPGAVVCPAACAVKALGRLDARQQEFLLAALAALASPPDVILVDTASDHPSGLSPFGLASPETVVVLSGNSHAITGAYSMIKRVAQGHGRRHFRVLINKVRKKAEGQQIFDNLSRVAGQRGVADLRFAGMLPADEAIAHAAWMHRPVVEAFPASESAAAFTAMASEIRLWSAEDEPAGLEQFMRHLLHLTHRILPNAMVR
jgi:flagellar biosynthesis protein FlhG